MTPTTRIRFRASHLVALLATNRIVPRPDSPLAGVLEVASTREPLAPWEAAQIAPLLTARQP